MNLVYKITIAFLVVIGIGLSALALVLSYEGDCVPAAAPPEGGEVAKAITYRCYGSADVLELADIEKPVPKEDEILVKVHAASVNPLDWHYMRGSPYLMRLGSGLGAPKETRLGVDFAGTVEAVGSKVRKFKPGDEVFGGRTGAFAEYLTVRENRAVAPKPNGITFEQAASAPIAALTALQALRDKGKVEAGQKVLINGASGGVGTFAVQIAKAFGAEVTGVCSTRNVDTVRSIGADHVFDYKREDYTKSGQRYDVIIDLVGNHSLLANRRAMNPEGILVIVGAPKGEWLGPLIRPINAMLLSPFVGQEFTMILAKMRPDDLMEIGELMASGQVTPVIGRRYRLSEVPGAIRHSEEGHARGKIIIEMD